VFDKLVAGRVAEGVPAFLVALALVVPLTVAFARGFAAVFGTRPDGSRTQPLAPTDATDRGRTRR
jgi:hypothetical protein